MDRPTGAYHSESGSTEEEHINSFVKVKEIFGENLTSDLSLERCAGVSRQARWRRRPLLLPSQLPSSLH